MASLDADVGLDAPVYYSIIYYTSLWLPSDKPSVITSSSFMET